LKRRHEISQYDSRIAGRANVYRLRDASRWLH
jgi:hypothetical protein